MADPVPIGELETNLPEIEIIDEIKEGNIKQVYEAELDGETVALKIVSYDPGTRLEGYTAREIEIMERIDSEYFVDLIRHSNTSFDGQPAFLLIEEFYPGGTLKERIDSGENGYRLGINVANALLHVLPEFGKRDIVHRDIKPGNVMFTSDGEVRLIDAGVARMNQKDTLTPDFKRKGPGTPAYSAPEILQNEKKKEDTRTDLFSIGVVLYEAVMGEHPFGFDDMQHSDAILQHRRKEMNGVLNDPSFEDDLNDFYLRLTEYEPVERYRTAHHALDDLSTIVETHIT